jgi:hypothetical protein
LSQNIFCKTAAALALALTVSAPLAAANKTVGKKATLQGYLVDVSCATEKHKSADWAAKHGKDCLTMDDCAKSGYAVLTADQKLYKFDAAGNEQAKKIIASHDMKSDWKVVVKGKVNADGNAVAVSSLALQQ